MTTVCVVLLVNAALDIVGAVWRPDYTPTKSEMTRVVGGLLRLSFAACSIIAAVRLWP